MTIVVRKNKTETGKQIHWKDWKEGVRFGLRSIDNDDYQVAIGRAQRIIANMDGKASGDLTVQDGERPYYNMQCEALSKYVLVAWEGKKGMIVDEEGNDLPYSQEMAEMLLQSDISAFLFVLNTASAIGVEENRQVAATVGKPKRGGDGKKNSDQPPAPPQSNGSSTNASE